MVLVVLLVMFLNSCITRRQNAQNHEVDKELSPYQRYIGSSLILVLHGAWAAKEVRLFHLKDFFANRLYEKRCEADQISMKSAKNSLNADSYAIRHLNLTLPANQRLCIVGNNGSGKSTFLKLLTRLYFPTEGEILLNGVNINEYDYEKYQGLFAPVFQDYSLYQLSLRENITFSDKNDNDDEILRLCRECGLLDLIERLPHGLDTSVYKFFDEEGFEPSGGEGQKIAIARALYHNSDVYLLDEPTAALDPVAEYEIYTQFHHLIHNKTAVLITHRLSAVQLADRVAVFQDGRVMEYGTHAQLYAKGGIYTEMFDKQAGFYREAASVKEEDCTFKQVD
ncbi:MAG: ABC transporter ATP-binding protein/permease [Lachnospiraceae bacterium]|nr:ABC transporter ATP-binding protein/permease [Lachnospiraceae bacterium]